LFRRTTSSSTSLSTGQRCGSSSFCNRLHRYLYLSPQGNRSPSFAGLTQSLVAVRTARQFSFFHMVCQMTSCFPCPLLLQGLAFLFLAIPASLPPSICQLYVLFNPPDLSGLVDPPLFLSPPGIKALFLRSFVIIVNSVAWGRVSSRRNVFCLRLLFLSLKR